MKICEILRQPQGCFLESSQGKKLVAACDAAFRAVHGDGVLLALTLMGWSGSRCFSSPTSPRSTAARLSLREAVAVSECRTRSFPSCKIFCGCVFNKEWMC